MNSWFFIRRLRGPAFIILVGITALLNQWGVLSFSHSWPLYLILAGVLVLAERVALAVAPPALPPAYAGPNTGSYAPASYAPTAYVPVAPYTGPPAAPAAGLSPNAGPSPDDPFAGPDRRS